jgi:hypothetical protein
MGRDNIYAECSARLTAYSLQLKGSEDTGHCDLR